ncbi:MAG: YbhB/YbcL family Raf kinase inhibitor-like protein [Gammaproteobacteria bacterium]|jgi:Raf kinase inhibitor-like YbhB/YbcL family protein|nr:YbhB/YbcL family Raf kinase inhibitor-like protein [Gammaproteobacteria bacterium]MBT4491808.1 YbhB/YbcL family Raf kinase inhibitor-like protein [Gammaproteobacteria bacterium]MBT7372262.1 YbhB/YbcL family Raf kinase inhibitor-like protein [Gammaproteobacteria bacterium]
MGFALSSMQLTSSTFSDGGAIPAKHTGEGEDVSPDLTWADAPDGTKAFAVVCHDPDAPLISKNGTYGYVHWVLYNIPANVTSLVENNSDYTSGKNDFGNAGFGGPMPPNGHGTHQYYFWVIALNDDSELEAGLNMWQLLERIEPNAIGMNRLVGQYKRD